MLSRRRAALGRAFDAKSTQTCASKPGTVDLEGGGCRPRPPEGGGARACNSRGVVARSASPLESFAVRFTTRPELRGTFGMVASTHWLASAAGMAVLERGGNAFDAAAAAGVALQVVEPHLNGPGGDMPAVLYDAKSDEVVVVCGQGPA